MKLYACLKEILQTNGDEFGLFHSLELSNLHLQNQPRQHILNQRPLMEKDIVIVNKTHRYIMVLSVKRELKDIIISKHNKPLKTTFDKISDEILDAKVRLESWFSTEVDDKWKFIPVIFCESIAQNLQFICPSKSLRCTSQCQIRTDNNHIIEGSTQIYLGA